MPSCPKCGKRNNVLREGDGYLCITCTSFGHDRFEAYDLVDVWGRKEEPLYLDGDEEEDAQMSFRELMAS